ncbi:MAG: hypothetical protein RDU76_11130 [Candidatus Edwardsbacteria bacterium]|nr:hypothetical protein [Candidatus Edwardsbacteria bacterium]
MNQVKDKKDGWVFISLGISFAIYAIFHSSLFFEALLVPAPGRISMTVIGLGFFCFAVYLSTLISKGEGGLIPQENQKWIVLFILSFLMMLAVGLYLNNPKYTFYTDIEGVIILFGSIILGVRRKNWEHLDKLFLFLLAYGIILNVASLPMIESVARVDTEHSVTNKLQVLIYPVLFYIYLYKYRKNRFDKIIIMSAFLLFIIEQILFQKRLPSARIIFTLFLMTYIQNLTVNPSFWTFFKNTIKRFLLIIVPLMVAILIISNIINLKITDSLKLYNERLTGNYGFVHNLVYDTRLYIGYVVVDNLITSNSFLLGKGFGGYILDPRLYWTVQTDEGTFNGAAQIEIGQTWPVWKGGLLFWLSANALFISLAFSFRKYRKSNFSLACWAFILTHFIFLMGENIWTGPYQFYLIILGVAIGHLLGRDPEQEYNIGGRLLL